MKTIRKISVIPVAILLFVSVFAGCGKDENNAGTTITSGNTSASTVTTTRKADATTASPAETNAGLASISKAKVGDIVPFGSYEQNNKTADGKEAIAWRVLAIENGKVLMISEKSLEAKAYNEVSKDLTWETGTLRAWLNNKFYSDAFSADEKLAIASTEIVNEDNPEYTTPGGNETQDKVFLLSITEATKYFANDKARQAQGTDLAISNGLWVSGAPYEGSSRWWLRSPGIYPDMACLVEAEGIISTYGNGIDIKDTGVRPALWIKLES